MSVPSEPRFAHVFCDAPAERAEELCAVLFELGASGVEIRDDTTWERGPAPGVARLRASFDDAAGAASACAELRELEPALACEVGEIVGDAWRDAYKAYFKPFALTPRIVVAPPWESYAPQSGERVLVMDPGRAFGTGRHATTALVAGELCARSDELAGVRVLDVGTGSGVLALAALLLGAEHAIAIDNDPEVLDVAARENADRNGLGARIEVSDKPLAEVAEAFEVVVANIRAATLVEMAADLARVSRGLLVVSGVLASERHEVAAAYERDFELLAAREHPVSDAASREEGEDAWVALVLRRRL